MPITRSAKKALRVSSRKKFVNDRRKKNMKDTIKKVEKVIREKKGDTKVALSEAYSAIDKALKKGVIKKNTASRRKAKLSRHSKNAK
jgi:small subunit ribosomal protein S20